MYDLRSVPGASHCTQGFVPACQELSLSIVPCQFVVALYVSARPKRLSPVLSFRQRWWLRGGRYDDQKPIGSGAIVHANWHGSVDLYGFCKSQVAYTEYVS